MWEGMLEIQVIRRAGTHNIQLLDPISAMLGDCMICMEMHLSGAVIGRGLIGAVLVKLILLVQKVEQQVEFCEEELLAVAGTVRGTFVLLCAIVQLTLDLGVIQASACSALL